MYRPDIESALRIAVEEINGDAPMGRKLKLQIEDSQTDPDAATRATQKLINVNRSAAIMGVWSSAETLAIAPMAIQSGTVLTTAAGAGRRHRPRRREPGLALLPAGQVHGCRDRAGRPRAEVDVRRGDVAQRPERPDHRQEFQGRPPGVRGRVVDSVTYPPNQSSYTGEVGRAIGKKADVIVNVGYTPELAAMMKDARNAPDKGTWLSVGWSVNQELFDAVGTAAAEGLYTVDAAPNVDGAAYANLRRAFQAKTGKELLASNTFAFYAYDSAIVVALAMAACECTKGAALTKAIAKVSTAPGKKVGGYAEGIAALKGGGDIDYQGAASDLEFDGKGDQRSGYGVYQVRNGKVELVKKFTLS